MDRGTERHAPPSRGEDAGPPDEPSEGGPLGVARIPLAVVVVDRGGFVTHWSSSARGLFGVAADEAVGRPAIDLLPVSGALPEVDEDLPYEGPASHADDASLDGALSHPAAGRARLTVPERGGTGARGRVDVLWWAYPLVGPGSERLLVLAADAETLDRRRESDRRTVECVAPAFALHTDVPGAGELARRLPGILPGMSVGDSARIVAQVLELGYPVLEFSRNDRVPVTPDWGVQRRGARAGGPAW